MEQVTLTLEQQRAINNPTNAPTGWIHERCPDCGSTKTHWNGYELHCYVCHKVTDKYNSPDMSDPHADRCDFCGNAVYTGRFMAGFRKITDGPFEVGDCCGERNTGFIRREKDPDAT